MQLRIRHSFYLIGHLTLCFMMSPTFASKSAFAHEKPSVLRMLSEEM